MACNEVAIKDLANDDIVVRYTAGVYDRLTVDEVSGPNDIVFEDCTGSSHYENIEDIGSNDTVYVEDSAGDYDEFLIMPSVCDSFGSSYKLDGMDGSSFDASGCTSCESSSNSPWDGYFDEGMGGGSPTCDSYPNNYYENWFGALYAYDTISVGNGSYIKKIYYAQLFFAGGMGTPYYYIWIGCAYTSGSPPPVDQTVWSGYKYCGLDPVGDYDTDNNGCDSTATLRVIAA